MDVSTTPFSLTYLVLIMVLQYCYLDPEELIESDSFKVVESFLHDTGRKNIGWHYIIDLTWIYSQAIRWPVGLRVLDAGGGRGPAQVMLAEMGFDVTNIDLVHTQPDYIFNKRYGTKRNKLTSYVETRYVQHILNFGRYRQLLKNAKKAVFESALLRNSTYSKYENRHESWRGNNGLKNRKVGKIDWLAGNLCEVPEIKTGSFDAVMSLSSLEHIPQEILPNALAEIDRMVKPNGFWAVTTSATDQKKTWYHQQSMGYCFSSGDIASIFGAEAANFDKPLDILLKYQNSRYLKDNLAPHYRLSGNNGMPWGKWNPLYLPVGIADDSDRS